MSVIGVKRWAEKDDRKEEDTEQRKPAVFVGIEQTRDDTKGQGKQGVLIGKKGAKRKK